MWPALTVGQVPIKSTIVFRANGPVQTHQHGKQLPFIDIVQQVREASSGIIESVPLCDEPYVTQKSTGEYLSNFIREFGNSNIFMYRLHTPIDTPSEYDMFGGLEGVQLPKDFNMDFANEGTFDNSAELNTYTYGFIQRQQNGDNHFWPAMIRQNFRYTDPLEVLSSRGAINHGSLHGAPVFIPQENKFPLIGLRGWPITTKKPNQRFTHTNLLSKTTANNKLISTVHRISPNSLASMLVKGLRVITKH